MKEAGRLNLSSPPLGRLHMKAEAYKKCEIWGSECFSYVRVFFFSLMVPGKFCALCFQYSLSAKHFPLFSRRFGAQESWQVERKLMGKLPLKCLCS